MKRHLVEGAAVVLLTAISFFWFPGHSILQSDTQIYLPILEHMADPAVLSNDIMAVRPHVSFTIYDEVAFALRRLTGLSFEHVLLVQQFAFRAVGIAGLYLIASAAGLSLLAALVVTATVSLGAVIYGPTVLTVELEPVPRGFALPFLLLSLGAAGYGRWMAAVIAAGIAWCFHPPTALAYCLLLVAWLLSKRRWLELAILAAAPVVLLMTLLASSTPEQTVLFTRIEPWLEKIQRMRAPYNWIGLWWTLWWAHYTILTLAWAAAMVRIRHSLKPQMLYFFVSLPIVGILSAPVSWLVVDQMKWSIGPLFQPARYLLFVTLLAVMACSIAGAHAAIRRRVAEAVVFFTVPFAVVLIPDLAQPKLWSLGLAAGLALVAAFLRRGPVAVAACILPFALIPTVGRVQTVPPLHSAELDQLARWARQETPPNAVFQFADVRRGLEPGVFRARALRAIYADWKAGGQVNYQPDFARLWWERWERVQRPLSLSKCQGLGIDYVIFRASGAPKGVRPVYENQAWRVFRVSE